MKLYQRLLGVLAGTKDIQPWRGGQVSTENGDNFVTNQVTVADYRDIRAAGQGAAVGLSATWSCVQLIAGTIASLPLMVYRTDANGIRRVARDHPLYFVLHDSPNYDQTAVDFWEIMAASVELYGNAYAVIERRSSDRAVNALHPIRPDLVKVRRLPSGDLEYDWTENSKRTVKKSSDVLHIRGPLGDAISGASTLAACRGVFDGAMDAEQAAAGMFRSGVNPSGILSTKPEIRLTPEQREEMEQNLARKYMGSVRQGRPMLLDNGLTWTQLTINPADAQMLESRKFSGEEICRIFGVPPAMVGFGDKSSNWGTGKEVDVLGFQKFTLRKRLKRIEQALLKQLVPLAERRAEGLEVEFNLEGLLRGDTESRYAAYAISIDKGWQTRNEVRARENLPPIEGGDVVTVQMQDVPLTEAISGNRAPESAVPKSLKVFPTARGTEGTKAGPILLKEPTMDKKTAPVLEIKSLKDSGEFEGYGSTFGGEPDAYGDVIAEGAYADSLAAHTAKGTMPKLFWQHNANEPIGKWLAAKEDGHGLLMRGKLNMDVQRGREAYSLLKEGDIDGLSIGYRIKEYSVDTDTGVWTLEKLDLVEVSVVSVGANEHAVVQSVKAAKAAHDLNEKLKAGDRLTEREFETWLKGLGFSNSQAERAARVHLKGQGEPADAAEDGLAFLRALKG